MSVLEDSRRLLEVWHAARGQSRARRALALAALAASVEPAEAAAWSLGARNAWLLQLVRNLSGPSLELVGRCTSCGENVEFTVDVGVLADLTRESAQHRTISAPTAKLEHTGTVYHCRALTSADILAVEGLPADEVDLALLARVLGDDPARRDTARNLPDAAKDDARRVAGALDPWAVLRLDLSCPACGTQSEEPLPIADAAWHALESAAASLVRDVHILARAYGWTEAEILSLPKWRRDVYAELTRA
jgi:hypothetical protein